MNIDTLTFEKLGYEKGISTGTDPLKIVNNKPPADDDNIQEIFSGSSHDIGLSISFLIPK